MNYRNLFATASLLLAMTAAQAHEQAIVDVDLDNLSYSDSPRFPGVRVAVVTGNLDDAGLYATHAWMEAGSVVEVHTHPDPRITVVTHGTMYIGIGESVDESKLVAFPEGSVFVTPANAPHFMIAKDGPVAVLDSGAGPTGITFR